ncbi:hypothetical protein BJ742DRAFT_76081 [Cladochytrium replicatum]|nr:hypothetical protein BJ742DRAFT_76081 [Cladochytrium replicatum]
MDFKSFFGHKAKNPQEMDINELNAAFLAFLDDCKPSPETHAKLLALPHEKKRAMLESYQKTRGNEKYHGLASTSSSGSSQKDKHTKREGITSALGMGMVGRRISHKSNRMSTSSSNGSLTSTTPEFMVSEPILNPPVTLNYSPEAIRDLNKKLTGMMVDLGLPPKVQADILNSTPENKQKMIDEFQRQLKGGVLKATPPPRGRSPGPGSMGSHNTSPLMPPLSPPKRDASLDPESKIRPRSSSYFDPTPIPLTRTPTASSLESIDSISPPSSPVILRPESITNLTGHELQKQFEYVLNELHLKEGPRNNIMRTSDETKKREIVRLFWDRQAQLQAQPVVQMRASHPPAPPASYPVPNPAVGFSQTKRLGTVFRPSMIPPSPLAPPPTVKFPEPSSFFVSSTSPHYPNVPRFQPGTAPPPPFTLMPVPENFAVTNSGQLPHFPPRKNFHPPADFMETRQQQRPLSIVSTPPVVLPNSSKTPPTDVPPSPFVDAPANKSTLELLAVSAPEPEAPPKIESMGTFEMTPALFINQMTNRCVF